MFVDLCAFPTRQMRPPIFDPAFPRPSVIQFTACPPMPRFGTSGAIIDEVRKTVTEFESQPGVKIVHTADDLVDNGTEIKVILGLQLPPLGPMSDDPTLSALKTLKGLGVHLMTLAYKDEPNPYGGGYLMGESPLTTAGKRFIDRMTEAGIWLDLSHAGRRMAYDCIDYISAQPTTPIVLASHGGVYEAYNNPRNLPLEILHAISELNGIIGIYALTFGLSTDNNTLEPFWSHLKEVVAACGSDTVAIGSDGIYENMTPEEAHAHFVKMGMFGSNGPWAPREPVEPEGLNGVIRKDQVFKTFLLDKGLPGEIVEKILSENAYRFLKRALRLTC